MSDRADVGVDGLGGKIEVVAAGDASAPDERGAEGVHASGVLLEEAPLEGEADVAHTPVPDVGGAGDGFAW